MQAILDFVQSYYYIPDSYGDAPRTPLMSLICKGGDCEDSSILVVALARVVDIDCVFTYFPHHVATACEVDGQGGYFTLDGKKYMWMETTGNGSTASIVNQVDQIDGTELTRTWGIGGGHKIGQQPKTLPTHMSRVDSKTMITMNWGR